MKSTAIQQLLDLIENQLNWGEGSSWLGKDFEMLNMLILEKTNVSLSASTLRRLWGKAEYPHQPSGTTLDTLALFAGYKNWRDFTRQVEIPEVENKIDIPLKKKLNLVFLFKIFLVLIISIIIISLLKYHFNPQIDNSKYDLSSRIITRDVPNSVVFTYDAHLSPTDSVFFQQSWDDSKRTPIDYSNHKHTSIYYRPGYYLAKLIIGEQIVKEHPILISTNGWLGMISRKPVPVYLSKNEFESESELKITPSTILSKGVAMTPDPPKVEFYNVGNFKPVALSDFSFSTEVRNDYKEGAAKCQFIRIMLITDDMPVEIPLSTSGCISDINLYDGVNSVSGKSTDLSGFGINTSDWVKVSCRSKDRKILYFVNDKLIYESLLPPAVKRNILGIGFKFQGAGAAKNIKLAADGKIVFLSKNKQ